LRFVHADHLVELALEFVEGDAAGDDNQRPVREVVGRGERHVVDVTSVVFLSDADHGELLIVDVLDEFEGVVAGRTGGSRHARRERRVVDLQPAEAAFEAEDRVGGADVVRV
jgi:hypothetical protein